MWSILDIDSGCITLCVTSLFTLNKHFVSFVSWFLLAISQVCTQTLNKAIINNNNKTIRLPYSECPNPYGLLSYFACPTQYSWVSYPKCPTPYSPVSYSECPTPYSGVSYSKYTNPYGRVSCSYECLLLLIDTVQDPASYKCPTRVGAVVILPVNIYFLYT